MPVSNYFQKFSHTNEQNLLEDLMVEAIQIYGHEVSYLPRSKNNVDNIYGEDPTSTFNSAVPIEMYIKNTDGFEGEGAFVGRFGLEIREQVTFSVARRTWAGKGLSSRPLEGDLIWFDMTKKLFEIQFVEHQAVFYQAGKLPVYDLSCELFEYSSEDIDTGVTAIDAVEVENAYSVEYPFSSNSGLFTTNETITGANSYATGEILQIQSTDSGNILRVTNIVGTFSATETITGSTSGVTATLGATSTEFAGDTTANNQTIQTVADGIIDFSEGNPFSEGSF
jgi:hypothetical protein